MAKRKHTTELIPAVAYLRKSTKGERKDRDGERRQKQEKSITRQRIDVADLASAGGYKLVGEYADEGISGSNPNRPDFERMLAEIPALGAKAIIVEALDRFSRATVDEVNEVASRLRKLGVRWIVARNGVYDLGDRHSIGEILKFVVAVWSACESSRATSRRVAEARRNAAENGKRTGGVAPYGYRNGAGADKGRLVPGDEREVATVRRMFAMVADEGLSVRAVARRLNAEGIKPRTKDCWGCNSVRHILGNRVYLGEFQYGMTAKGKWYSHDEEGQIQEREKLIEEGVTGKVFATAGAHEGIIAPDLFARVQKVLAQRTQNHDKPRENGHLLSGRIICKHCGGKMYGHVGAARITYRCATHTATGKCAHHTFGEDDLLPFVVKTLAADLRKLAAPPECEIPVEVYDPNTAHSLEADRLDIEAEKLNEKIRAAIERMLDLSSVEARRRADAMIVEMEAQLKALTAARFEQIGKAAEYQDFTDEDRKRIADYIAAFEATLVRDESGTAVADGAKLRALLGELGVRIELWFRPVPWGARKKFEIEKGRMTWATGNKAAFVNTATTRSTARPAGNSGNSPQSGKMRTPAAPASTTRRRATRSSIGPTSRTPCSCSTV